ncbi:MAG: hypothetical protein J6B50_03650 [Lachnospiraceae bacterium]|nr:hypothetical protein [Lachnospiraceae bacterium]MBP3595484.1 hypothetical protein [Lachnospiraceae bacterium]
MGLYKKLDFWSVMDELDRMIDYDYNGNEKDSLYWDYYVEQIQELGILAADLLNDLDSLKSTLWYKMPDKHIEFCDEDDCTQTAIAWFNTAACLLSDTDMQTLLEKENIYQADEFTEKQKRLNAIKRLTKEQQMFLYTEVIGFLTRYLELSAAFDTITAVIAELDYHQSAVTRRETVTIPPAAYV